MTNEIRKVGRTAEERLVMLAKNAGHDARLATQEEDYSQKTDVIVEGRSFQVSCQPKSRQEQKRLRKRGILPIEAGGGFSDENILEKLHKLLISSK